MPGPIKTFRQVLEEAVEDLYERGFDSQEQVSYWLGLLRAAAERELGTEAAITEAVRGAMDLIFRRLVERGRVVKYVPDVGRYTLSMLRPELRAELDRRILASADLIKLRRRESIESTLARFQGWATSIPPGGGKLIDKREVRAHVAKDLKTARWERRRVEIDQGHKLVANIAEIVASGNGAIAVIWRSNWRQPGYNFREDHKERDGVVYLMRRSWAREAGLVKPGPGGFFEDLKDRFAQAPFCRCYGTYIRSPRRLPREMLTRKGLEFVLGGKERDEVAA